MSKKDCLFRKPVSGLAAAPCYYRMQAYRVILVVALVVGIIAGPIAADGFDPYEWGDTDMFTKQITRCIIAIQVLPISYLGCFDPLLKHFSQVMAVGIELPK